MAKRNKKTKADIKIRFTEGLRAKIERSARDRGVSMNAEMIARLDRSFEKQGLLKEVLTLAYHRPPPGFVDMLVECAEWNLLVFTKEQKEALHAHLKKFVDDLPDRERAKR